LSIQEEYCQEQIDARRIACQIPATFQEGSRILSIVAIAELRYAGLPLPVGFSQKMNTTGAAPSAERAAAKHLTFTHDPARLPQTEAIFAAVSHHAENDSTLQDFISKPNVNSCFIDVKSQPD